VRLRPAAASPTGRDLPRWLSTLGTYATYLVRRDFISWFALLMAAVHQTHILFAGFTAGGIVTALIVTVDHVKLRRVRRSILRRGQILESAS
jgi:membrane protein implicated in regulation of membrane protease activity